MSDTIAVVIVEDHALLAEALTEAIDATGDIEVLATVTSVAEAAELLQGPADPDVVLTDLELTGGDGVEVAAIAHEHTSAAVLIVTGRGDQRGVTAALRANAAGFISKSAPLSDLTDALRRVAGGAAVFPADLLQSALRADLTDAGATLSAREIDVLELLATGATADTIADELDISINTTRNHIRQILAKLHANTQLQAVVTAVRNGIISI